MRTRLAIGAQRLLCRGASTLVSALQGGPDVIIDGQRQLLRAARDAGVIRFIPSDYSLDLFNVKLGHIPTSDWRRRFASVADAERGNVVRDDWGNALAVIICVARPLASTACSAWSQSSSSEPDSLPRLTSSSWEVMQRRISRWNEKAGLRDGMR